MSLPAWVLSTHRKLFLNTDDEGLLEHLTLTGDSRLRNTGAQGGDTTHCDPHHHPAKLPFFRDPRFLPQKMGGCPLFLLYNTPPRLFLLQDRENEGVLRFDVTPRYPFEIPSFLPFLLLAKILCKGHKMLQDSEYPPRQFRDRCHK